MQKDHEVRKKAPKIRALHSESDKACNSNDAPAGSRTRITSMGSLYDAATLQALVMESRFKSLCVVFVVSHRNPTSPPPRGETKQPQLLKNRGNEHG